MGGSAGALSHACAWRRVRERVGRSGTWSHSITAQQAGDLGSARKAFEQAARGHEEQYSGWHAAKDWERAADIAAAQRDAAGAEAYTSAAVDQYVAGGRLAMAADAAARGAKSMEESAPEVRRLCCLRSDGLGEV